MAKKITILLSFLFIVFLFKNWLIFPFLSAHDWPYFFKETLSEFPLSPSVWASTLGIGLGGEIINYGLGSYVYFIVSVFVNFLGLPWEFVYKVLIFGLFIVSSVLSSSYLLRKILDRPNSLLILLGVLIFTSNTYILMLLDGGQIGVALAYAISPLVLARFLLFMRYFNSPRQIFNFQFSIFNSLMAGIVLAIQVMFDMRIAFITISIVLLYTIYHYLLIERFSLKRYFIDHVLVGFIVFGFHASWFLPMAVFRSNPAEEFLNTYNSIESFRFFSFATFSQTLSLLHPNWPENIFGKVSFMKSEFLILPLFAYASLLVAKMKSNKTSILNNRIIPFFALLGLLGAFLAKGANPPLSFINNWLFVHLPFSALFRDPTKFYLFTVLSYSILIPFTAYSIQTWLNSKLKLYKTIKQYSNVVILSICILYFLFLIRPVLLNQLNGTFKRHEIPKDYIDLKDFLHSKTIFSRTLWIPTQQRFSYYSYEHPAIAAEQLFPAKNSAEIVNKLAENKDVLSNASIKYIIVPYDSFGEIFVKDRKYDDKQYENVVKQVDSISWLNKISGFGKIAVYENKESKDHFWINGTGSLSYKQIGVSEYQVRILIDKPAKLIFADSFNPHWRADTEDGSLTSMKSEDNLNSFLLNKKGEYSLRVYFSKEKYYSYGRIITLLFVVSFLLAIFYNRRKTVYEKN